jgi:RNA polymerase sigma-70 factor (ECF subfamily)
MTLKELSDGEILQHLKARSAPNYEEAFAELVRRHKGAVMTFLTRYTGSASAAEDLAQEAFVRVYRAIASFDLRARFTTWLYAIAANLAKDEFKRRRRHPAVSMDWRSGAGDDTTRNLPTAPDGSSNPEEAALQTETGRRVQETLDRLAGPDREVLILRDIQGLKYEEISAALRVPMGTVKSRIARAREAFRGLWEK